MRTVILAGRDTARDRLTISWLCHRTISYCLPIACMTILNAAEAFVSVWAALLCKKIVDAAVSGEANALLSCSIQLMAAMIAPSILNFINELIEENTGNTFRIRLQEEILRGYLSSDHAGNKLYHSEEVLNRLFSDVNTVVENMVSMIPIFIYHAVKLVAAAVVILYLAPVYATVLILISALLAAMVYALRKRFKRMHKRVKEGDDILRAFIQEVLSNSLVIRTFQAQQTVMDSVNKRQENYRKAKMKRAVIMRFASNSLAAVFSIFYGATMIWGCYSIILGRITYGTLVALIELEAMVQSPLSGFSGILSGIFNVLTSAERIMELQGESSASGEVRESADAAAVYRVFDKTQLRDVSFSYESDPAGQEVSNLAAGAVNEAGGGKSSTGGINVNEANRYVLRNVNMEIRKGDITALTGFSGAGKSTLFLIMMGIYKPMSGSVLFFDTEGELIPEENARAMFAYVPQENMLFTGTVCENVTLFEKEPDEQRVWEALKTACADIFVSERRDGIHAMLKEKGHGLSEGQMQRLAIARAIYSGAPFLLLDEATSALDEETERQLMENIVKGTSKTCLIVTHRESTLEYCVRRYKMAGSMIDEV